MSFTCVYFFLLTSTFVFAKVEYPPEITEIMNGLHSTCLQARGLTENDFKKFDLSNGDDSNMKCYIKCLFVEFKWMDENEVLQNEHIKETVLDSIRNITVPYLEDCGKKAVGETECEKSFQIYRCMHEIHGENWELI